MYYFNTIIEISGSKILLMKKRYLIKSIYGFSFLLTIILISINNSSSAQGISSYIGDRENIGIFGGPAVDLSYSNYNQRIFAAVSTPFSLFYSDDTCKNWHPAFPVDSLEYSLGSRGWGGGAKRVITNQVGWVAVHTGSQETGLSSVAISYNGGSSFQTAFDPNILQILAGVKKPVSAIALSDYYCYIGLGPYLVRTNEYTVLNPSQMLLKIDTIPGISNDSYISWIAASNGTLGFPIYFVVKNLSQKGRLFKFYGDVLFELGGLPSNQQFINIFTHPAQASGDSVFVSARDTINQQISIYRSYSGGFNFDNITPTLPLVRPLADVDYSQIWAINNPPGQGLRISFPRGLLSDDLGLSWQGPSTQLENYGIATDPNNSDIIIGSDYRGVRKSETGIGGVFSATQNIGFASVEVLDFSESGGFYYVATRSGLAYTSKYFDPAVIGYEQWIQPNGMFPVPNVGNNEGVSCVAIDPANPNHVICGNTDGFNVTFTGPGDFTQITPSAWNAGQHIDNFVTDLVFVSSSIVVAVTGQKFNELTPGPPQQIGNIWRSIDGGINWSQVTPLFPYEFFYGNCLAIGDNGTQIVIYAGTGYDGSLSPPVQGAFWASYDLGQNWQKVNNSPAYNSGLPLPIYDIDVDPNNNDLLYVCAGNVLSRSDNGGQAWFNVDIPHNFGIVSSALIDIQYPDSIVFTAGRNVLKYSYLIDDADIKFKGLPGEFFTSSSRGSVLGGSNTGVSKIIEAPTYLLNIKMFIEGPFNGTDMSTDLNTNSFLPLNQPFNQAPWYYSGTESVPAIPNPDIVDWVLLDLRKTTGNASTATKITRFDRKAVFLLKDGTLVDDDGISEPRFNIILSTTKGADKVHGVVYAPAHVEERTADSLSQAKTTAGTFSYDFTSGPDQAFGGITAHKELAPGVWGLISGDGNQDAQVDNLDKNEIWLAQLGNTGYFSGDFNRDGTVDQTDLDDFWKPNSGRGVKIQ